MPQISRLDLTSLESYRQSCLNLARDTLDGFHSMAEIAEAEDEINAYPRLDSLSDPRDVHILDIDTMETSDLDYARQTVLDGGILWEHTAAGEATRLKLGTKYLIHITRDIDLASIAKRVSEETGEAVGPEDLRQQLETELSNLLPLNLGVRHMLQMAFDITRLAEESGANPADVLGRQKILLVMNEKTADVILNQVYESKFKGFKRENFLFMVQPAFPGITLDGGRFVFDPDSPRRLHNHGQLVMQETMDDQIFRLDESGRPEYLKSAEMERLFESVADKISYPIEELGYLTGSIDWSSLTPALKLGRRDYNMVMEIVANNPDRPIKGGLAAYDDVLKRNVMIESFQLKGMPNEDIHYLNKNFNHYTNPVVCWRRLKEQGLPMPVVVKNGYLYFQPVQGDINFLVDTAFVMRKIITPIRAWKSASDTVEAINAMWAQDNQPGFRTFVKSVLG
jgi:hypothetical protein